MACYNSFFGVLLPAGHFCCNNWGPLMKQPWQINRGQEETARPMAMERQNSVKSRKSKTLRSISRSLMLCNGKDSDDGSNPDEKYPSPFDTQANGAQEETGHCSRLQFACPASSDNNGPPDPLTVASLMQLRAAASDSCKNVKRKFLIKVNGSLTSV